MQRVKGRRILVLGAGNYGTCLAQHLATMGHEVTLWARDSKVVASINEKRKNPKYLTEFLLHPELKAVQHLTKEFVEAFSVVVLSTPTQSVREVLTKIKDGIHKGQLLICAAKGIEVPTGELPLAIFADVLGNALAQNSVFLAGPSFAVEVMAQQPTAVSMGCKNLPFAQFGQEIFHTPRFRIYTTDDPIGLEVAGALKNVIAIASGACSGIGFQANAKAALITRGLAEMTRVGVALNANPLTFTGLGGVGDLFLTCTSEKSRNYTLGYRLGKGEKLQHVIDTLGSVAEGVPTTKSAFELGNKLGVSIPITTAVYEVLYEGKSMEKAANELMTRDPKNEIT